VLFLASADGASQELQKVEVATRFYGLDLQVVTVSSRGSDRPLQTAAVTDETLAVVTAENTLRDVEKSALLKSLTRTTGITVPLLVMGVTPDTDPILLRAWSGGAVARCELLKEPVRLRYAVGDFAGFTGQLTGMELPFPGKGTAAYLQWGGRSRGQEIISVRSDQESVPVFVETTLNEHGSEYRVFWDATRSLTRNRENEVNAGSGINVFTETASAMMFIKYIAGKRGWHALHKYANLTIDDPLLKEPYGLLSYTGLLAEMEKHNFHSTIAFIPWNYDRSEPSVVSLLRSHPERFSISIHGNNHDHKEFTDYHTKPLDIQIAAIGQSLARMEQFHALTGLAYDRVMVFPHGIAPGKTLEALRDYSYLSTYNSTNIPEGSAGPTSLDSAMRVTLSFAGLPSVNRFSIAGEVPGYFIAIQEFLDNPLLFYCHHQEFSAGIGVFDPIADQVNRLEPDTYWRGLGEISKHLYLVKQRDDGDYDVFSFSNSITLENQSDRDAIFYIRKPGTDDEAPTVMVDGHKQSFQLRDDYVDFHLPIPRGQSREIAIRYAASAAAIPAGIGSRSLRTHFLRASSEFRDDVLYTTTAGRGLIHLYYAAEENPFRFAVYLSILVLCASMVVWRRQMIIRRRHVSRPPAVGQLTS
jgi:hypothetical protein